MLGVWAHPDDEAYLSGGLMALARDAGQRVVCLTATRGELGTIDPWLWPPHQLAVESTIELGRCLDVLGRPITAGSASPTAGVRRSIPTGPSRRLATLLDDIRPDTVLTFGPDGFTATPPPGGVPLDDGGVPPGRPAGHPPLYALLSDRWSARWATGDDGWASTSAVSGGRRGRPAGRGSELTGNTLLLRGCACRADDPAGAVVEASGGRLHGRVDMRHS